MWKNIVQPERPQVMRMRIACWIPKATDMHSEYVIITAFPLQQWLYERARKSPYMYSYIARPVNSAWIKPNTQSLVDYLGLTLLLSWRMFHLPQLASSFKIQLDSIFHAFTFSPIRNVNP